MLFTDGKINNNVISKSDQTNIPLKIFAQAFMPASLDFFAE